MPDLFLYLGVPIVLLLVIWRSKLTTPAVAGRPADGRPLHDLPDPVISLVRTDVEPAGEARRAANALEQHGFLSAGGFTIPQLANTYIQLFVHPEDGTIATVAEHASGIWCDLVRLYADGTLFAVTNAATGTGLEERPGRDIVRLPGTPLRLLQMRARLERPVDTVVRLDTDDVSDILIDLYSGGRAPSNRDSPAD